MSVSDGTRIGSYEVGARIGAGGMGEVYRATDTRLKRQVAIKILPSALAGDADRLARFQREAEVLASLNHPHIATVFGLEETAGVKALVMELVEGPTLADRIAQGPLSLDEALPIARQLAEALEAAHERGIIHRDLKPANVKVRHDGSVKVLDFGLAKLTESAAAARPSGEDLSQSPTIASARTEIGTIVGTVAYMSPEQARGRAVDKRTDVWAFGAVLYEMLAGRRAFAGEDTTEILAEVVKSAPDWTALPAAVPPHIVTLVQRCLDKDRNTRIGDMAVARFLLSDHAPPAAAAVMAGPAPAATAAAPRWRAVLPWALAAALAVPAIAWLAARARDAAPPPVTHLQMSAAPAARLGGSVSSGRPSRTAMAISTDGRRVVFSGEQNDDVRLYVRDLDGVEARPIAGTDGAAGPFFSPDGAWIAFWAGNTIKKVPAAGGPAVAISNTPTGTFWGATWAEDGTIYFANGAAIMKVPAAGGVPEEVIAPDETSGERRLLPHALPGGKALLFTTVGDDWDAARIVLLPLDGGERRVLVQGGADARYVDTGHLLYVKTGTLMAVPFDIASEQVTGAPVALIGGVMQGVNAPNGGDETGAGQFAISRSGTLLYATGGIGPIREQSMVWVDRNGAEQPIPTLRPGPYLHPRLSPDDQKVAVQARRGASRVTDVWVHDIGRGTASRLTFEGNHTPPLWSPDGKRVAYATAGTLYSVGASGGTPERLGTAEYPPAAWSSTNVIALLRRGGSPAILVLPANGNGTPQSFIESRFQMVFAEFSPDGRWMTYVSNESGPAEVYVQPYPGPGEKIRISSDGGLEPIWARNGREIFYRSSAGGRRRFMSVAIRSLSPFVADTPRVLFESKPGDYDSTVPFRGWDASADGRRFLLLRPVAVRDDPVTAMHVVLNWTEELKRRVPVN